MRKLLIILTALISTLVSAQQHTFDTKPYSQHSPWRAPSKEQITKDKAAFQSLREQTVASIAHYPIKNMLGVNVHQWDVWYYGFGQYAGSFDAKYKALIDLHPSSLRLYLDADLTQDSSGNYAFNPTYRGGFEPETGIKRIKASNPEIFVQACYQRQTIQNNVDWKANTNNVWDSQLNFPWKYNNPTDRLKPSSYANMAHDLAVITTRGGRNPLAAYYPIYTNFVSPWENNFLIRGENFYDAVEGGNEWDWWWSDFNHNLNANELAAAWKAMYDSVKKVDPTMLFTNGGIAWDQPDTFQKAIKWWNDNGYQIPVDYFSYHCYPDAESKYGIWQVQGGLNPEEWMGPCAKKMVNAVGSYKPVVIGEWGYDVNAQSVQNAPAFSSYTAEQTRAYWAIRAVLLYAQAGIYRAQWYRAYQDWPNSSTDNNPGMFATMALLRQYNDGGTIIKRTLVGDCFKQANQIGDYVFDRAIRDDSIKVLQFKNGINYLYAAWAVETYKIVSGRPVYTERKFNYNFTVSGTRFDLNEDSSGVLKQAPFYGGTLQLSSKPFFIVSTTILPIKDTPKPTPKPKPHQKYNVEVYRLKDGFKIIDKKDVDIDELKAGLPMYQHLVIKYWNSSYNYVEKIFKTNK